MQQCNHSVDINHRLARINGQVNGIREMVNTGRPCEDVLTQLSSVSSAITQVAKLVLTEHMEHCITNMPNEPELLAELKLAIDQFAKLK